MNRLKVKLGLKKDMDISVPGDPPTLEEKGLDPTGEKGSEKWADEASPEQKPVDFDNHTIRDSEYIDPDFFKLDFMINGKVFRMAVDHILRIKRDDLSDASLEEVHKQLEACSYYRFSFFAAAQQVGFKRRELERAFRKWLAGRQEAHRRKLMVSRKTIKEELQIASRDLPGITKDEVLDCILLDPVDGKEYDTQSREIETLKQKEDLLIELRDALHDRGFHLGGIADRTSQQKKVQEF